MYPPRNFPLWGIFPDRKDSSLYNTALYLLGHHAAFLPDPKVKKMDSEHMQENPHTFSNLTQCVMDMIKKVELHCRILIMYLNNL